MEASAPRIVVAPPGGADLSQPHAAVEPHNDACIQQGYILKQPFLQDLLIAVTHDLHFRSGTVLVYRCGDRVGCHISIGHGTLAADVQHHPHILEALGAERAAVPEISMLSFLI